MGEYNLSLQSFSQQWPVELHRLDRVTQRFPFRINPYYAGLIRGPGDPIWRQVMPDARELEDTTGWEDPLAEEDLSPVPNLVHRYPNRVLWLVSQECAVHCRFCTRKRRWNKPQPLTEEYFQGALGYISSHREVRDVILSGGDPLLLSLSRLERILMSLRKINHVEVIRIGTRVPCALPEKVTEELAAVVAGYHPVYVNVHFNHPWEITPESRRACALLANAGIPLGSQTVLLRGVNDRVEILAELFQKLLSLRVRPYYLMQMDLTRGAAHFRTPLSKGLEIVGSLRNHVSGMAIPHFVIDLPGGRGKVPLVPDWVEAINEGELTLRDYRGNLCAYPLLPGEGEELARWLGK
jgi:lysine 2,3-aminomutase